MSGVGVGWGCLGHIKVRRHKNTMSCTVIEILNEESSVRPSMISVIFDERP